MRALNQVFLIAGKEWRLLLRNPHALAVLFVMPAVFLLVMSFALKNTLLSQAIALPKAGWVVEDSSSLATIWSNDWIGRNGGERFGSRALLQLGHRRYVFQFRKPVRLTLRDGPRETPALGYE